MFFTPENTKFNVSLIEEEVIFILRDTKVMFSIRMSKELCTLEVQSIFKIK